MSHYDTLGVNKDSTTSEIKKAYRKLASKHHPDKGGDTAKFQEIKEAYDILSNSEKRAQYDNPQQGFNGFSYNTQGPAFEESLRKFHEAQEQARKNRPVELVYNISLEDAYNGSSHSIRIGGRSVSINIPLGIDTGRSVKYSKLAPDNRDLVIHFRVDPHAIFERIGMDLITRVEVSYWDLLAGTTATVQTIGGTTLKVNVKPFTEFNTKLRLSGQGMKTENTKGDLYVIVTAKLPTTVSDDLLELIKLEQTKQTESK